MIALGLSNLLIWLKFICTDSARLTFLFILLIRFELDLFDVAFDVISE